MDIIHLLPDSVANQIAAGEVIQRPASCLKELVENSLDAGAHNIQILLYDAGRTMMQVIDDGKGMSEMDARMAFERHATSKIQSAQDLFALRTMGFRGEALASICAVAHVELQTRRPEDEMGTKIEIHGSEVISQEPCQCAVGANFKIKNLFYNVPARRRFLKTDATELRNILNEFYRIVLVNPQCQFTIANNDEILVELTPGNSKQRIEQVFGKSVNKQFTAGLVEIKSDTELVSIRGYVGKPEFAGKTPQQYFFVNNRYMRHPYFHKAIMTAYSGMLPADHNPSYFVYFDINPEAIDVNIHPTKTEIKFADEQSIWQILLATVREALGKFNVTPTLDFDSDGPAIPIAPTDISEVKRPAITFDPTYNPFNQGSSYTPEWSSAKRDSGVVETRRQPVAGWQQLYESAESTTGGCPTIWPDESTPANAEETDNRLFEEDLSALTPIQYAAKYIILPSKEGLLLVDQHRAHVAVLFRQYCSMLAEQRPVSQQCLFPEVIELTPDEMLLVQQLEDDLRSVGFELEQFSRTSYVINGVPASLAEENPIPALQNIIASVKECGLPAKDKWQEQIAASLAEDAAIRSGRPLSEVEMRDLLRQLFALPTYGKTPAGKSVLVLLSMTDIEKLF